MSWLRNLSIQLKIMLIPIIGISGFVLFFLFIINSGTQNSARLAEIEDTYFPVLELANSNIGILERMGELMGTAVSTGEEDMLAQAKKMAAQMHENLNRQAKLRPGQASIIKNIAAELTNYTEISLRLTQQMIDGTVDFTSLAATAEKKRKAEESIQLSLQKYRDDSHESFIQTVAEAKETEQNNRKVGVIIGLVTIAILLAIAFSISRMIYSDVKAISESLRNIAEGEGDLTRRLPQTSKDELGELVHWFNVFVDKLHSTIGEVVKVIAPLSEVSLELNSVSKETARTSNEQSHSSELVSDAMSDMLRSVTDVAGNAGAAASAATEADNQAQDGLSIVQSTVSAINDLAAEVERAAEVIIKLESDTESVGSILGVIKGVAEQTNLLALNAAIEAARAGDQGRGFAVVADEVRTLASRTQESTHEIQAVIEQLQGAARSAVTVMEQGKEQAKYSVEKAVATGNSLQTITSNVAAITDMNQQIASATEEQQRFARSIEKNVSNMREASKIAASSTEKVSNLSNSLQQLANQLNNVANQFRV